MSDSAVCSVADELEFDALPEETQKVAERVLRMRIEDEIRADYPEVDEEEVARDARSEALGDAEVAVESVRMPDGHSDDFAEGWDEAVRQIREEIRELDRGSQRLRKAS